MTDHWHELRTEIEFFTRPFPRQALAFARAHRDDVAPHLVDALYALIEDTNASFWARNAPLEALVILVFEGAYPREALINYLQKKGEIEAARLRAPDAVFERLDMINSLQFAAAKLGAPEMSAQTSGWLDENLLDPLRTAKPTCKTPRKKWHGGTVLKRRISHQTHVLIARPRRCLTRILH